MLPSGLDVLLVVATAVAVLGVPGASRRASPVDPCHLGVIGGVATTATLAVTRSLGERALAVAGYRGRFALLALGIAAHGIGWDAWHYARSAYIPDWYSIACLELDIAMALYVAARIPRWRATAQT